MRGRGQHPGHTYKRFFATADERSLNFYIIWANCLWWTSLLPGLQSLSWQVQFRRFQRFEGRRWRSKLWADEDVFPPLSTLSENVKMSLLHFNQNVLHRTLWSISLFSRSIADALLSDGLQARWSSQNISSPSMSRLHLHRWLDQIFLATKNNNVLAFNLEEAFMNRTKKSQQRS